MNTLTRKAPLTRLNAKILENQKKAGAELKVTMKEIDVLVARIKGQVESVKNKDASWALAEQMKSAKRDLLESLFKLGGLTDKEIEENHI